MTDNPGNPDNPDNPGNPNDGKTRTYEMLWDCEYCGKPALLGKTHRYCPECGGAQNPEKRYFPPEDKKVAVEDHVYTGADLKCPACGTPGSAAVKFCGECAHPLEGAQEVKRIADQPADSSAQKTPKKTPKKTPRKRLFLFGSIALVAAAALFFSFGMKKKVDLVAAQHTWQRTIAVEQFKEVRESEWCDEMPKDAFNVTRHKEARTERDVPDGEECRTERVDNGDGTFSEKEVCTTKYRSEAVEDDKCNFSVKKWEVVRTAEATGGVNDALAWPQVTIQNPGTHLGAEREGARKEAFVVHYTDATKKTYTCEFSQDKWRTIAVGSRWMGKANNVTGNLDCQSLAPAK